ncbi:Diphthamide biosynthesis protein 4 [Rhodotorula toruloides]
MNPVTCSKPRQGKSTAHGHIRTAYRQLILRHHPDRLHARADEQGAAQARELNQAWEVLRDEAAREAYDQARKEYLTASRATSNACAVSLSLDLFDPHYSPPSTTSQSALVVTADAGEPVYYSHPCRCSSHFLITREQLEEGVEVVGCEGCSERCRVEYEVVEE